MNMRMDRWRYAFLMAIIVVCGTLFVSCENEDPNETSKETVRKLTFKVNVEDFEAEPAASRSSQVQQPSVIDLGNGLVAEISVQPDTQPERPALKSRAALSDGRYKIYVLDASGTRLSGVHKELNGTVSGGVFTPDANEFLVLNNGTYTFVCINDAITDHGTSLSYTNSAVNPMIGVTTKTLSQQHEVVNFTMKHQTARVRFRVTSYTASVASAKISFVSDSGPDIGGETFDLQGTSTGKLSGTLDCPNFPFSVINPVAFSPFVKAHTAITNYLYYVDGTNMRYIQFATLDGTLHGKPLNKLNVKNFLDIPGLSSLKRNHSYLVNFTLKSKAPLYLYQDGTVGYLGDKDSRIPIGVVAREKTESKSGLAVALRDVSTTENTWGPHILANTRQFPYQYTNPVPNQYIQNILDNDVSGYEWTYNPAYSSDNTTIKGQDINYPAFYKAANYNAGVPITGTNISKWFLPSMQDFIAFVGRYGADWLNSSTGTQVPISDFTTHFTDVGGTEPNFYYHTSTEVTADQAWNVYITSGVVSTTNYYDKSKKLRVRPFCNF